MKKLIASTIVAFAATTASAGNFIYAPTKNAEVDAYSVELLNTGLIPLIESNIFKNIGVVVLPVFDFKNKICFISISTIAGINADGSIKIFKDSYSQRDYEMRTNISYGECTELYKSTMLKNFKNFYEMTKQTFTK